MARTKASVELGAQARDRILDAALDVFATKGFRGGSLADIAEKVGMTRGSLLYHFGTKDGLLIALLARRDADTRIMQDSGLPDAGSETANLLAKIRMRSPRIRAALDEMKLAHVLQAEAANEDHPAREWVAGRARQIREHFATHFAEDIDARDADAAALAAVTLAVIEGLESQWLIDPDSVDIDQSLAVYERLVQGLLER